MWIDSQWLQTGLRALRDTLDVDGRLRNQMIEFLFEEGLWDRDRLSHAGAIARWNACMNPNKAEFFKQTELWALMKRFQRHALFEAMAQDLGYRITRIPTEERRQELLERMAQAQEHANEVLEGAAAALSRLDAADTPPAVAGNHGRGSQFSLNSHLARSAREDDDDPSRGPF